MLDQHRELSLAQAFTNAVDAMLEQDTLPISTEEVEERSLDFVAPDHESFLQRSKEISEEIIEIPDADDAFLGELADDIGGLAADLIDAEPLQEQIKDLIANGNLGLDDQGQKDLESIEKSILEGTIDSITINQEDFLRLNAQVAIQSIVTVSKRAEFLRNVTVEEMDTIQVENAWVHFAEYYTMAAKKSGRVDDLTEIANNVLAQSGMSKAEAYFKIAEHNAPNFAGLYK